MVVAIEILVIACAVMITWFAGYVIYRLVTEEPNR